MQNVNNKGNGAGRMRVIWEISVLSSQLFCKSKAVLKLKIYLKKYKYKISSSKI